MVKACVLISNSVVSVHDSQIYIHKIFFISVELQKLSWSGLPKPVRPTAWKILSVSMEASFIKAVSKYILGYLQFEHRSKYLPLGVHTERERER